MGRKWFIILSGMAVLFFAMFTVFAFAADKPSSPSKEMKSVVQPAPDSGVVACEEMAKRYSMPGAKPKLNYDQARVKFASSQVLEIRDAGVNLVDVIQRVDKALSDDDTPLATSLGAVMALRIAWEDMQTACGKHGIDLPDLPA